MSRSVGGSAPAAPGAAADARLARVRRADWRFVLPDPKPGLVWIGSGAPAGLVEAWAAAGARVERWGGADRGDRPEPGGGATAAALPDRMPPTGLDPRPGDPPHAAPDVVVLPVHASRRDGLRPLRPPAGIAAAAARLVPGGWLVIEVAGTWRHPLAPSAWAEVLRGHGLVDTAAFLHWPGFAACSQIVPAADAGPLRWALERGIASDWPRSVARLLARPGVAGRLTPCFTAIGRKPGWGPP